MSDELRKSRIRNPWVIGVGVGVILLAIDRLVDWAADNVTQSRLASAINSVASPVIGWLTTEISMQRWFYFALVVGVLCAITAIIILGVGAVRLGKRIGPEKLKEIQRELIKGYLRSFFSGIDIDKISALLKIEAQPDPESGDPGIPEIEALTDHETHILRAYGVNALVRPTAKDMAATTGINILETEEALESLESRGFLTITHNYLTGRHFKLGTLGRKFILKYELHRPAD